MAASSSTSWWKPPLNHVFSWPGVAVYYVNFLTMLCHWIIPKNTSKAASLVFFGSKQVQDFSRFFILLGEYFNRWGNLCHECSFPRDLLYEPKLFLARREARLCYVYWKKHLLILGTCDLLSSQYHKKIWICIRAVSIANRCICSPSLPAEGVIWLERKSPPIVSRPHEKNPLLPLTKI